MEIGPRLKEIDRHHRETLHPLKEIEIHLKEISYQLQEIKNHLKAIDTQQVIEYRREIENLIDHHQTR